jgi:phenylpropionate dioxygenase-like ring-hydroxylating dioxygenase large terminal subunit
MIEKTIWHPVVLADEVTSEPVAAQLLEHDLVLWRDASGAVHAWMDQCPHRGAQPVAGRA